MSRRPRSVDADIDLIAHPDDYIAKHVLYASGALQVSIERYLLLKRGATARLNRRLLIGHPESTSWLGRHLRRRRGWTIGHPKRPIWLPRWRRGE